MSTPTATELPDGYKAPAALVDADHHGAWVHICNGFGLVVILISLGIRTHIRSRVSPPLKYDDYTLAAATFLAIVQCSLSFTAVREGFGTALRLLNTNSLSDVQKLSYASDIFYILTIYFSKASVVLLFKRIAADRMHNFVAWGIFGTCLILGLTSLLMAALRCDVAHPWAIFGDPCESLTAQTTAIAAFDIATELMLFSISLLLVWELHTAVKNKSRVVFAFGTRLPVIAVIVLRLVYLRQGLTSDDPTLKLATAAILTQLEIFYGIMAATVPCLRPFLVGFSTNYGAMGRDTIIGGSQIGTGSKKDQSGSKGSSFALSSLASRKQNSRLSAIKDKMTNRSGSRDLISNAEDESFRPDPSGNDTKVTRGSDTAYGYDARSIGSDNSQRMIIKKEIQFHIGSEKDNTHLSDAAVHAGSSR